MFTKENLIPKLTEELVKPFISDFKVKPQVVENTILPLNESKKVVSESQTRLGNYIAGEQKTEPIKTKPNIVFY